jgi:RNase P/RNase MRP subunit p29
LILTLTEDNQFLRIDDATELELEQIKISLTKRIDSWRFHPLVKRGIWDGYVSYIKDDKWIPAGLWQYVMSICKEYRFELKIEGIKRLIDPNINPEVFEKWSLEFFKDSEKFTPRDYQIEAAFNILKFRKCLAELATSAGKTLISFLTVAYILEHNKATKILFIVPNVSLVVQAHEDFHDYNYKNKIDLRIQQIFAGQDIKPNKNIIIGTYQSLIKKDAAYFSEFDAVIVDECIHPDTLIKMSNGSYKKVNEIKAGEYVKTTNDKTLEIEDREVEFVYHDLSKGNQMFELEMEDGSIIKITGNHRVKLTSGIYKRVDQLSYTDDIFCI